MKSLFVITGTSRGLGNALETELLSDKKNYIISINRTNHKANSKQHTNLHIDLSTMTQQNIQTYQEKLLELLSAYKFNKIFFINNAFTISPLGPIHELDNTEIIKSCHTNIISAVLLLKTFISITKNMPAQKNIVNISSGAAKYEIEKWSIYCLSKASIKMFIQSIEKEYKEKFYTYDIDPGIIDTSMQKKIRLNIPENRYFIDLKTKNLLNKPQNTAKTILKRLNL